MSYVKRVNGKIVKATRWPSPDTPENVANDNAELVQFIGEATTEVTDPSVARINALLDELESTVPGIRDRVNAVIGA